jgi:hypothetical protein
MKRHINEIDYECNSTHIDERNKLGIVYEVSEHISKKQKKSEIYVNASDVKNYMINDTIVDFLKVKEELSSGVNLQELSSEKKPNDTTSFTSFLLNQGIIFEKNIIENIKTKHTVVFVSDIITDESINSTILLMKSGIPIIHSAPVVNNKNNTRGIIDLLIRSDFLHILTGENPLTTDEILICAPKLCTNNIIPLYHYVVVDIKFSTIPLRADGIHILNTGLYPAYKSQILIYNDAVALIQGYKSKYGFIYGRKCSYTSNNVKYIENKLGIIDYTTIDNSYISQTKKAINWVKNVKKNGKKWKICSKKELYPNMKIDSFKWNVEKKCISNKIGEITSLWNCGVKNRNLALKKNIKSLYNPLCNSNILGIKGNKGIVVDMILNINRQSTDIILPKKIINNLDDWRKKQDCDFYVDFEILSDIIDISQHVNNENSSHSSFIFIIGVSYIENNIIKYTRFICNNKSKEEEKRIISEFLTFVRKNEKPNDTENRCKLYYWSAEEKFWNNAKKRHNDLDWNIKWIDILKIFIKEPIVIKDCFDFKLKNIASNMYKHGLIETKMESNCKDGMIAMIEASKLYESNESNISENSIMKDIIKYNMFDCNVLCDILSYLRINH